MLETLNPEAGGGPVTYFLNAQALLGEYEIDTRALACGATPGRMLPPPEYFARAGSEMRGADVVHIHGLFGWHFLHGAWFCRQKNIPFIVSAHGHLDPWCLEQKHQKKAVYLKMVAARLLKSARVVLATTGFERDHILDRYPQLRVRVVAPGTPSVPALPQREQTDGLRLLFLARLHPVKALPELFNAIASLRRDGLNVSLDVAGSGDPAYTNLLHHRVGELDLTSAVRFHGYVDAEQKQQLLRDCDVFVLPSYHENFAMSAVEAMSHGLPLVLSDQVGLAGEIQDQGVGLVVRPGDSASLESALRAMLDPDLRLRAGNRAQELARTLFSIESFAQNLATLYQDAQKQISG